MECPGNGRRRAVHGMGKVGRAGRFWDKEPLIKGGPDPKGEQRGLHSRGGPGEKGRRYKTLVTGDVPPQNGFVLAAERGSGQETWSDEQQAGGGKTEESQIDDD